MSSGKFSYSERPYGCGICLKLFATKEQTMRHFAKCLLSKQLHVCTGGSWTSETFQQLLQNSQATANFEITSPISYCGLRNLIAWAEKKFKEERRSSRRRHKNEVIRSVLEKATELHNQHVKQHEPKFPDLNLTLKSPLPPLTVLKRAARTACEKKKCSCKALCIYSTRHLSSAVKRRIYRKTHQEYRDAERVANRLRQRRRRAEILNVSKDERFSDQEKKYNKTANRVYIIGNVLVMDCESDTEDNSFTSDNLEKADASTVRSFRSACDFTLERESDAVEHLMARRLADKMRMRKRRENPEYRQAERLANRLRQTERRARIREMMLAERSADESFDEDVIKDHKNCLLQESLNNSANNSMAGSIVSEDLRNNTSVEATGQVTNNAFDALVSEDMIGRTTEKDVILNDTEMWIVHRLSEGL